MSPVRTLTAIRTPPYIPGLSPDWQAVANRLLADLRTTPDTLLITADALDEAAEVRRIDQLPYQASLLTALSAHLRKVAPGFAS